VSKTKDGVFRQIIQRKEVQGTIMNFDL